MEIQIIKISEQERKLVSEFIGEDVGNEIDFNRLMPVVKKVFDIINPVNWDRIVEALADVDINKCFYEIVKCIKWYNQNKK